MQMRRPISGYGESAEANAFHHRSCRTTLASLSPSLSWATHGKKHSEANEQHIAPLSYGLCKWLEMYRD